LSKAKVRFSGEGSDLSDSVKSLVSTVEKTAGLPRSQGYLLPRNDMGKKVAFTLAEVLITLGIIGVVAAMTLPTLINNYRKQETIAKLKKVYSVLGQASLLAQAEYGETSGWVLDSGKSRAKSKNFSEKYLIPYLKVVKKCEDYSTSDCNYPIYKLNGQRYSVNDFNNWTYRFYLADGTFLIVYSLYDSNEARHPKYASIIFDINGEKRPNKWGRCF